MEIISKTTQDTKNLAGSVAKRIKPGDVIALYGDLGTGKTTFTRHLVEQLGFGSRVQSPTFVIARKYSTENQPIHTIHHIDLYRTQSEEEINDLGLEEMLGEPGSVTVIEWPEMVEKLLPEKTVKILFEHQEDDTRKIYVQNID